MVMKPGETAKKRLVVRGSKPFRILQVQCDDPRCAFDAVAAEPKSLHFVALAFAAGQEAGEMVSQTPEELTWAFLTGDLAGGANACDHSRHTCGH